jgi:hypothetical protein
MPMNGFRFISNGFRVVKPGGALVFLFLVSLFLQACDLYGQSEATPSGYSIHVVSQGTSNRETISQARHSLSCTSVQRENPACRKKCKAVQRS